MGLNIFPQTLCSGDTIPLKLTFTNPDGTAHNLVGNTVGATVKDLPEDSIDSSDAIFWQDIVGDATGIIQFYLGPFGPGDFWLDIKIWQTTVTPSIRTTVLPPVQLHIIQSVTTR